MSKHKFCPVKKDRWFYDRYEYCMSFYLDEASCLRVLDHAMIDDTMERRRQWREIAQQRWVNGSQKHGTILSRRWREITPKTIADLHTVADKLISTAVDFKLVVSVNQGWIYTNDLGFIDQLSDLPELALKSYTQACIDRPKNTIQLKNPTHRFRTYFKLINLTGTQKDHLVDFLQNQRGQIRISPALERWVDMPFARTQDYFFVDHNNQHWLTMLSLVQPGLIRKTMHIIAAK